MEEKVVTLAQSDFSQVIDEKLPLSTRRPTRGLRLFLFSALIICSLTICAWLLLHGQIRPQNLRDIVERSGNWGMVSFVAGVVLFQSLWLPRMWGLLMAGLLFGPRLGIAISLVADMTGATLFYLIAQSTGRESFRKLLARRPRAARVIEILTQQRGALVIFLLRVCPLGHFTAVSYAAGLADVRPGAYFCGTFAGLLPAAIIYPFLGGAVGHPGATSPWIIVGAATLLVIWSLGGLAMKRLFK